jgi:hypothetical protein
MPFIGTAETAIKEVLQVEYNFIDKAESFNADFTWIPDGLKSGAGVGEDKTVTNKELHHDWRSTYCTRGLADHICCVNDLNFERFDHPRAPSLSVEGIQRRTRESTRHRTEMHLFSEISRSSVFITRVAVSIIARSPDQIKTTQLSSNFLDRFRPIWILG